MIADTDNSLASSGALAQLHASALRAGVISVHEPVSRRARGILNPVEQPITVKPLNASNADNVGIPTTFAVDDSNLDSASPARRMLLTKSLTNDKYHSTINAV